MGGDDARYKLDAGACLAQTFTGLVDKSPVRVTEAARAMQRR
jgi:dihydroorotate dehydrogenase